MPIPSITGTYTVPTHWPPIEERIFVAVIQGLTSNLSIDQSKPELIASKAIEITNVIVSKVVGSDVKLGFDHNAQRIVRQ